jgi:phosphoribosylformylglycinamidine cyclo-ligase
VPPVPPVLAFIQQHAGQDDPRPTTLNMGAGFALFVAAADAERTVEVARGLGIDAWWPAGGGRPQAAADRAAGLRFGDDALQLR